ncbi:MAG: DUF4959 domain-containing protein [Bacteroidales bacterium]|jgi:hypothetical protein|nr:DUF4959 domain-containing protein [Bacteroidales bacterium]
MSVIFLLTVFQACKEEEYSPLNKGGSAPAKVSDVKIAPLPGAARISYQVPDDKNFLYVKAEAEIRPGVIREIKASYYTSELVIDGFSDTTEFVVRLYSVGRNDMVSEPEIVTVVPKTPPVFSVFESLKETIVETFGGIKFEMDNPSGAEVRIYVNTTDSLGNMVPAEIFYTSAATDRFSVRGYDTDARPFSIYVQDRWGNTSGTYENIFHPLLEKKLDKTKFRSTPLTGDMNDIIQQNRPITNLWDDALTDATMYQTNSGIKSLPHTFTIDLGVKAYLSRVVTHGRVSTNAGFLYNAGMPQQWEIYGSTDPNPDGSLDESWIPLREGPCVSFKPSGLPLGEVSDDDYQRQLNGEEFEFDRSDILVRYIRFSINSAWGGLSTSFFNMTEITLFGNVEEEIQ